MNLNKIIKFISSSALIQVLNLILSFLSIKLLSLSDLGRYNISKSIAGSFLFANLGFRQSLDRKLPETNNRELNRLRFSICIYINTVISILILMLVILKYGFNWFYIIYGAGGAFIAAFTLTRIYFRGTDEVEKFIKSSLVGGVVPIIFPIIGLYFFGLYGLGIAFLISSCIIYIHYSRAIKLIHFNQIHHYKRYAYIFFKVGNIIYLTNLIIFMANNFDRFMIESFVGLNAVGEYGIVILVFSLSLIIPGSVLEMVFPQYIRDRKEKLKIKSHVIKHLKINVGFIGTFILVSYCILPLLIPVAFESYTYLLEPMQTILFAMIPYAIIGPIYGLLFAFDKHKQILLANTLATLIYFIILYWILSNDYDILKLVYIKIVYSALYLLFMVIFLFYNVQRGKISL